ncbi:hypothetical protein, partial [Trichococcus palustris]|uniref:hypothetical protein n=1 Tax=Trichococcus palustris TaxID=140314 RepID=UPI001C432E99
SSINLFFSFKYTKMDPIEGTFFSVHSIGSILKQAVVFCAPVHRPSKISPEESWIPALQTFYDAFYCIKGSLRPIHVGSATKTLCFRKKCHSKLIQYF